MSGYFNVNNNASSIMNSIFSSLGNSNSGQTGMLGDYFAIQNGSYYKMAKKFYANEAAKNTTTSKTDSTSLNDKLSALNSSSVNKFTSASKSKAKSEAMTATGDALSTLGKLMDNKLYDKVTTKSEDGTSYQDYNRDAILDNLKGFVKDYNNVLNKIGDSSNKQTLENGVRMVNQTKIYASALEKVGIAVEDDNTLKIDEKAFANADMQDVKDLFTGSVSFAKNTQSRMLQLYSAESMSQTAVSGLYNAQAVNQFSVGSMFDSMF